MESLESSNQKWKVWKNAYKTKVITLIKTKARSTTITSDLLYQSLGLPGIAKTLKDQTLRSMQQIAPPPFGKVPKSHDM